MKWNRPGVIPLAVLCATVCGNVVSAPFSVSLPSEAKPWEKTAADELKTWLSQAARGGEVSVGGYETVVFHVGDTDFAKKTGLGSDLLRDEEWVIRNFGGDVVLNGGGTRGCLYAVCHFLEDFCGVRWWSDVEVDVPAAKPLDLPALDHRGKPFFLYRDIYRNKTSDPKLAARCRVNGNGDNRIPYEFGGGFVYGPPYHCHVWDKYFPFEKYGREHPEWYALRNGKRVGGQMTAQMCLTCPGLADEFVKAVEKSIALGEAEARKRGLPAPRLYDLSMNDNWNFCECGCCRAEVAKYGHSGHQLRFVNRVAGEVGKRHPELLFSTFAYYYTEPVPTNGVRAADNVVVKLCNTRQNMAVGIEHPDNAFMHDQTIAWQDYAKNLFVWEYAITFNTQTKGFPFPSEFHIVDKFRFYAENGVKGFLVEQEEPEVSDMYDLKFYLLRKVMEDPTVDGNALIDEFMAQYFGAAGAKVLEARRYLERIRVERAAFVTWFPTVAEFNFIRKEDVAKMRTLFAEAEAAVKADPKLLRRVRKARASIDRIEAVRRNDPVVKPPEKGVSERAFYDFRASDETGVWRPVGSDFKRVEDSEAVDGKAFKVVCTDEKKFAFPFSLGVYDPKAAMTTAESSVSAASCDGYRWYALGRVSLPKSYYLYFSRQWTLKLQVGSPDMDGRTFDIRAHLKFTGPLFGCTGTENAVYVDRVVFETPTCKGKRKTQKKDML